MKNNTIPISPTFNEAIANDNASNKKKNSNRRTLRLSLLAILVAACISFVARFLIHLIDWITNIAFYGKFTVEAVTPADNQLGLWVIIIPAIGGLIVGLMALYGSKAIRGHGIPEAMEQILTNESKIKPSITYLKPISSAITIGTGGPFGAEGPIIATGGALGSTLGQLIHITPNERKILLAAGATAGMAAIFNSPLAAILLAIELLLFEFSARSFIPVALACITGAAGHHLLFGNGVVFPMVQELGNTTNSALLFYSICGIIIGLLSVFVTNIVYWLEDMFEKLPIHWAWWPALGGLVVGIVGYFSPRTLGVGYENITDILSGNLSFQVITALCVLKFISWAISLSSGTSGGTLAPLLTIGGAVGAIFGTWGQQWFPDIGISVSMAALVGMSALFAGASRAFLTSIVFALETTGQSNALLPLVATCTTSYFTSFFLMDNTIMTEKIARRGVATPDAYEPDILQKVTVGQLKTNQGIIINSNLKIAEIRDWINHEADQNTNYLIVADEAGTYKGILSKSNLFNAHHDTQALVGTIVKRNQVSIHPQDLLKTAVNLMAKENIDLLPVVDDHKVQGILTYQDILGVYKMGMELEENRKVNISLHRQGLKLLVRGNQLVSIFKGKNKDS